MESQIYTSAYKTTIELTYLHGEYLDNKSFASSIYYYFVMHFSKPFRLKLAKLILANDSPATNEQYY